MTTTLTEKTVTGEFVFEFSDKWQACKYDDLPFYGKIKSQGLKGVDFMARSDQGLLLMEVKYITASDETSSLRLVDNSDHDKIHSIKALLTPDQQKIVTITSARPYLADEVVKKIKDTLLGLFAGLRNNEPELSIYSQALFTTVNPPILVLLFLERNAELNKADKFKPMATNLKLAIEQKLAFLGNIQIQVVNSLTLPAILGIKVFSK